jgi:coenzyme F420 hydrogenase subunit beta
MFESPAGLLLPRVNNKTCNGCGLCLKVCPGGHLERGLLSPQTDPFIGNCISAYCGQATDADILQNGQSGGMVTALLTHLLDSGRINSAVVTRMPEDGTLRPKSIVTSDAGTIRKSQASQYCPVALGSVAQKLLVQQGEKTAVVGLACHFHGLANARSHLKTPAPFGIGLVCDRMLTFGAIDYLVEKAKVNRGDVASFQFRSKKFNGWPGDGCIRLKNGAEMCVPNSHRVSIKDIYTPVRCRLCFDKMNVLSDLVVGDAWGVREDRQGYSVVIARTARGQEALASAKLAGALDIEKVDMEKIFKGQSVEKKRRDWTLFTTAWQNSGMSSPDFEIDRRWFGNIKGAALRPYQNKINWAIRLANMTAGDEVLNAAKRRVRLNKIRSSLSFRGLKRFAGEIWKRQTEKIVRITGASFENKGAEAMLLTVAEAIGGSLPGADIVARLSSGDFQQARTAGLTFIESPPPRSLIRRVLKEIKAPKISYKTGAVIDVGGYQFGDFWGEKSAQDKAGMFKIWASSGDLVFFLPQAWGPFSSAPICDAVRDIINTATLAFARDKTSLAEMQKLVGAKNPKVRLAHDIAWNFKGDDPSVGSRLLEDAGLSRKDKSLTVCLTPNVHLFIRSKGAGPQHEYIIMLRNVVEHLCREHNAGIILVGHMFLEDDAKKEDDRTLCNYILSGLDRSLPVVHLDKALPATQIKSVIGNCDLLLSSRYHALIAAMSQQIPSAAIGWSHKYDELMADVGLSSNVISFSKTKEDVLQDIDSIVRGMAWAKNVLASTVPAMKQSGQKALDEVISAIKEKFGGIC